jgi:hypothetical protein
MGAKNPQNAVNAARRNQLHSNISK